MDYLNPADWDINLSSWHDPWVELDIGPEGRDVTSADTKAKNELLRQQEAAANAASLELLKRTAEWS